MGAECSSETFVSTHKSTRRYNPEYQHQHIKNHFMIRFLWSLHVNIGEIYGTMDKPRQNSGKGGKNQRMLRNTSVGVSGKTKESALMKLHLQ
jgi:hypothetical protein